MRTKATPYGYCQCGCGERAPIAMKTNTRRGFQAGQPQRYVLGHTGRPAPTLRERFFLKVRMTHTCWVWTGATTRRRGYGRIRVGGGEKMLAHRLAYEWFVGPIPEGLVLDHLCRNPRCCNPQHLEAVDHRENCLRGTSPWAQNARKTHCANGHEFTPENTRISRGARDCRACKRERAARAVEERRLAS